MDNAACAGAIFTAAVERRHRTKMNKAGFPELIALTPVYPGVERLYTHSRERA